MHPHSLPFDILGQVAPILAWVEGERDSRLPSAWTTETIPHRERERNWLLGELPTYSYDNINDILEGARRHHPRLNSPTPAWLPEHRRPRLSPPAHYDLLHAFRELNEYFLTWNGTEPCIRKHRMVELHELAIRIPAGHIVRHGHARTVAEGVITFSDALKLPELITLLPSNSFGLRSVIRQGLSESHLHLKGVTSAEEIWADSLLMPLSTHSVRGKDPAERRLLLLNLFAGRILALAIWASLLGREAETHIHPQRLLQLFDRIYFARDPHEEYYANKALEQALEQALYKGIHTTPDDEMAGRNDQQEGDNRDRSDTESTSLQGSLSHVPNKALLENSVPSEFLFLLRWIAPTIYHLKTLQEGKRLSSSTPEDQATRHRLVHELHLAAHLRLAALTPKAFVRDVPRSTTGEEWNNAGRKHEKSKKKVEPDPRRHFLHEALFRYLVCRTHNWQQATQQGRTTGLRYFREYYASSFRKSSGLSEMQSAELVFEQLRRWHGLRVLEGRVGPPRQAQDLVPWILAYARPKSRRIKKFGMVVHFKKQDENAEDKSFSKGIKNPTPRLRWGKRRRLLRDEGMRLYRLLQRPTPVTPFIVGIDACNLELSTPPEVFAPVFRFLREFPISLSGEARRFSTFSGLESAIRDLVKHRRLGMTYHVGEDFRHLLSGLRAIYEVVHFLGPQPGDRLGHGTALALHPKDWLEHNGYQAVLPRLEWLDTLVWVHHFLGPGDNIVGELSIEDRIQRLAWEIYNCAMPADYDPLHIAADRLRADPEHKAIYAEPRGLFDWDWSPLTLWDAWSLRQLDPYSVDLKKLFRGELTLQPEAGFCEEERRWHSVQERIRCHIERRVGSRNAYVVLALYWLSEKVRRSGEEPILVNMKKHQADWLELCHRVEEKMKTLVHEKELVVEVNPTANRIIGPMDRYDQHHVFNLTLDENRRLSREVRVCVNTDNPAVCNTTLAHEHYILGEILIAEGVPEAEVVKWLDWLRENGNKYNFARRLKSADEDPSMEALLTWLRRIRPDVREERSPARKHQAFWNWMRETRLQDSGFTREDLDRQSHDVLERIVALEAQLKTWKIAAREASDSNFSHWEAALQKIEDELAMLRESCIT